MSWHRPGSPRSALGSGPRRVAVPDPVSAGRRAAERAWTGRGASGAGSPSGVSAALRALSTPAPGSTRPHRHHPCSGTTGHPRPPRTAPDDAAAGPSAAAGTAGHQLDGPAAQTSLWVVPKGTDMRECVNGSPEGRGREGAGSRLPPRKKKRKSARTFPKGRCRQPGHATSAAPSTSSATSAKSYRKPGPRRSALGADSRSALPQRWPPLRWRAPALAKPRLIM